MKKILLALGAFLLLMILVVLTNQPPDKVEIDSAPIVIPQGYTLVAAASHGQFAETETLYCEQNETHRAFVCTDGEIGQEITLPAGHRLVAVSEYGKFAATTKYYCQNETTGEVSICR